MSDLNAGQINATVGIRLPSFTDSNRPSAPDIGLMIYNSEQSALQIWDGTEWISAGGGAKQIEAVGGTVSQGGGYRIHTYTTTSFNTTLNDTFTVSDAPSGATAEVLVVAGGGGGGGNPYHGGGGGAGGVVYQSSFVITSGTYNVQVGRGGTGYAADQTSRSGVNSIFGTITAIGGGGGATGDTLGWPGGSGGGSGVRYTSAGGAGTPGQGYGGGVGGTGSPHYGAAGGGGAGGPGANGTNSNGGAGGPGVQYNISGTSQFYAGGGGGSAYNSSTSGAGGSNIGGAGAYGPGSGDAVANTGSGGGGRDFRGGENKGSANGSAGIVIIKYVYQ